MTSQIDDNTVTVNPRAGPHTADPTDGPTANITPATETAPRGRVIDDSARGTIFWEAYPSDTPNQADSIETSDKSGSMVDGEDASQDWGKPFRIEWMSTARLPFYRTRGLRNPWNANREVKIARDGTELEPSVGRKLVGMFHRPGGVAVPNHMSAQMLPPPVAVGATQGISNGGHGSNAPFPTPMTDGVSTKQGMPMPRYDGQ